MKQVKIRNSFTISQRQAGVQASPKTEYHPMITCEDKCHCELLLPLNFITEHDSIWCGITFLSVRVNCPGCFPSQIPVHSQSPHWWVLWGVENALTLPKHCSATAKTSLSVINSIFTNYRCNCYKSLYFYYIYAINYTYIYIYNHIICLD